MMIRAAKRVSVCLVFAFMLDMHVASPTMAQWTQWGGPQADFKVSGGSIAKEWPDEGPKQLWKRKLGEGYSAILVEDGILYTQYRPKLKSKEKKDPEKAKQALYEITIAMKADTGETLWENKSECLPAEGHVREFGNGPRSTPLIVDDKLYTIGVSGVMHCLDKKTGKVFWHHDLWKDYGGTKLNHGYSSSPFHYKNTIIALVGGKGHAMMAFDKDTGKVLWQKNDFDNSYCTPKLINVDGKDQLICFMATEIVGIDPATGDLEWSFPHKNQWKQNVTLPIWDEDHLLFITSEEAGGSRGLKLTRKDGKTEVEQVWANEKLKVHHTNAIRVGEYVYCSAGGRGPSFVYAINAKTGEIAWKERGLAKANMLYCNGQFLLLDEDGNLALAELTPEHFKIKASYPMMKKVAWTVPTLAGRTLYIRDQDSIIALDLG